MEFGYGSALALVLTGLLLASSSPMCGAPPGTSADDRPPHPLRRLVEVEIPVLLIVLFAVGPYAWMG